ncbi:hypothetical protein CK203_094801 [Vitis vinifera]|uniref:Uncharacterized protein n=1 Tax=Vitis vinifera TaxID=29760 RepID=A0A438CZC6_VITVI|nr:hypothetical protein CK203_094801 [Vitis vinifera]
MIASPSSWISITDEALQAEATRVLKGDCNFVCGLDVEVVEADTSLRPLNVILAYGSSVVISSRRKGLWLWFSEWGALNSWGMAPGRDCFYTMYGPSVGRLREELWEELGTMKGLGGYFNVVRFLRERNRDSRPSSAMRRFSEFNVFFPNPFFTTAQILLDGGGVRKGPSPFRFENMALSAKEQSLRKQALKYKNEDQDTWDLGNKREDIKDRVVQVFHSLLSDSEEWRPKCNKLQVGVLGGEDAALLEVPFSEEEVFGVLWDLNGDKAPGPDDFSMKGGAEDLKDFRPINLVGSLYKLLAKGRQILDASLIANESIDSMQKGGVAASFAS